MCDQNKKLETEAKIKLQRIARRDKKAFLNNQCKDTEENNRMGKTRDLFKKIRDTGNISCKDGTIRTEMVWTRQTKKDLHDPDKHNRVITHIEPEILEGKVKWA